MTNHLFTLNVCDYVARYINELSLQYNTWTTATKRKNARSVSGISINYDNISNHVDHISFGNRYTHPSVPFVQARESKYARLLLPITFEKRKVSKHFQFSHYAQACSVVLCCDISDSLFRFFRQLAKLSRYFLVFDVTKEIPFSYGFGLPIWLHLHSKTGITSIHPPTKSQCQATAQHI